MTSTPPPVRRFEDLLAWQEARLLSKAVWDATHPTDRRIDRGLMDQLCRAARSVMANIAEGFEKNGRKEFAHALTIAKGSCGEVRSFLHGAEDEGNLTPALASELRGRAERVSRLLHGLREGVRRGNGGK